MDDLKIRDLFNYWNSKAETGKWKTHRKLLYHNRRIIQDALKKYDFEDLRQAIDNYASIVQNHDYRMSYLWTLYEFLTRRRPGRIAEGELQLYRFLPDSFSRMDFELTPAAKSRIQYQKKREAQQVYRENAADTEEVAEIKAKNRKMLSKIGKPVEPAKKLSDLEFNDRRRILLNQLKMN